MILDNSASDYDALPNAHQQVTPIGSYPHSNNILSNRNAGRSHGYVFEPELEFEIPLQNITQEGTKDTSSKRELPPPVPISLEVETFPGTNLSTLDQNTDNNNKSEPNPSSVELDHGTVWERCLRYLRKHISSNDYKLWFEPIKPIRLENQCLIIAIPDRAFFDWIEENCVVYIREALDLIIGEAGKLKYVIDKPIVTPELEKVTNRYPYNKNLMQIPHQNSREAAALMEKNEYWKHLQGDFQLNPDYTFENFIEGDCNRLARNAGYAVFEKPGQTSFNPLMLYGGVGLGKTHLLHAIGNAVQKYTPEKRVIYISVDKFTNQFIDALKNNKLHLFSEFYTQIDILLLDDVQYLAGKDKIQEMFFNIFNTLKQFSKQIVLTSDRPPAELEGLQDRLISRFKSGLTADLQQPDLETRLAILHKKIQNENIFIPDEIIDYLANAIDTNIRELEGAIITLIAQTSLTGQVPNLALAKKIAQDIVQSSQENKSISIDDIQQIVSDHFNLTVQELKDKTRKKEIVTARQVAMYLAKQYTEFSLKSIGYHFGGRDHSTVIHAIQCVEEMLEKSREMKAHIEHLSKILAGK